MVKNSLILLLVALAIFITTCRSQSNEGEQCPPRHTNCNLRHFTDLQQNQFRRFTTEDLKYSCNLTVAVNAPTDDIIMQNNSDIYYFESHSGYKQLNYPNSMLVEYNLECGEDEKISVVLYELDLEPKNCHKLGRSNEDFCSDYIQLDFGTLGNTEEFCGNHSDQLCFNSTTNGVELWFKTSETGSYPGFRGAAICQPAARGLNVDVSATHDPKAFQRIQLSADEQHILATLLDSLIELEGNKRNGLPYGFTLLDETATAMALEARNSDTAIVRTVCERYINAVHSANREQFRMICRVEHAKKRNKLLMEQQLDI